MRAIPGSMLRSCVLVLGACGRVDFATIDAPIDAPIDAATDVAIDAALVTWTFAACEQLVVAGNATCSAGLLELSDGGTNETAQAWIAQPFDLTIARHLAIEIDWMVSGQGGDGAAIVLHADPRGTAAVGASGYSLGYEGIAPSAAIELDTHLNLGPPVNDSNDNHVGIDRDGAMQSIIAADPSFTMVSAYTTWVEWDAATGTLAAYAAQGGTEPTTPIVATPEQLSRLGAQAWIGVTAGTGATTQTTQVLRWRVVATP